MSISRRWLEYIELLKSKEGVIENTSDYISRNLQLINYATLKLRNEFPVYEMIMLVNNQDFLSDLDFNSKISGLKKIFEIFFGYAKNLLVNFSIYRDKFIKISTSQIFDHLSKFPNYSRYLSLIGYDFQENYQEWRFSEKILSDEHENKLQCITVCCALGYDYWNNCLKYLSLNIFNDLHASIENLVKNENCEFCDFKMDSTKLMCTVCQTNVDKMSYFDRWKRQPIYPQIPHKSLDDIRRNPEHDAQKFSSMNGTQSFHSSKPVSETNHTANKNLAFDSWTCKCTFVNSSTQLNCTVCYEPIPDKLKDDRGVNDKPIFIETDDNSNIYRLNNSVPDKNLEENKNPSESKNDHLMICFDSNENILNSKLNQSEETNPYHTKITIDDETEDKKEHDIFDIIFRFIMYVYFWFIPR